MSGSVVSAVGGGASAHGADGIGVLDLPHDAGHFRSAIAPTRRVRVCLLERFRVSGEPLDLSIPKGSQRLLAFVALHPQGVSRDLASGVLWPEVSERRAHANLRSALRRLGPASAAVQVTSLEVSLAPGVSSDFTDAKAMANGLLADSGAPKNGGVVTAITVLSRELLPGWYDDWVLLEAENWRQLRLHALEAAARALTRAGRFGEAACTAAAAVAVDPLRESARTALINVHIAEGNRSEAIRAFDSYRSVLRAVLAVEPTNQLRALVIGSLGR